MAVDQIACRQIGEFLSMIKLCKVSCVQFCRLGDKSEKHILMTWDKILLVPIFPSSFGANNRGSAEVL
jgi:hypothetical protein